MITYREFTPHILLKDYIQSYWYFSLRTNTHKPFDILPDGYFDLLIIIKGGNIVGSQLTGIWSKSVSINYSENTEVFGIRFKPLAIGGLFKFSIKESLNRSQAVILTDFDVNGQIVLDGLHGFPEFLVNYLDTQFMKLRSGKQSDSQLKNCFELIDTSAGSIKVDNISQTIGLSTRQLHRIVHNMIGVGVKDYSKIVRFKRSLRDIKNDKSDHCHYYDQSHYIKEVKHFTGLTPEKLNLKNNDRFLQYYDFTNR